MLTISQLASIKNRDPYLYETLMKIVREVNLTQEHSGISPAGQLSSPDPIGSLSVTAANGFFDVVITDRSAVQPGINYFVEYDSTPDFGPATRTEDLGASRTKHIFLGNLTLYWRAYSQYVGSASPSSHVTFGNPPNAVVGGGAIAPPTFQAAQGSGTSQVAGGGFGISTRIGRAERD